MNNKGNIMISLLFFIMGLGVLVAFISPINEFLNLAQNSENLNCKGYIYDGSSTNTLSFNETLNNNASGSPMGCLALKLYLPYLLLVFLIGGLTSVLGGRAGDMFGVGGSSESPY